MTQNHMKRLATPRSWAVLRKENTFITRPKPGKSFDLAMPFNQIAKVLLHKGRTTKEVRYILHAEEVLVNGKRIYDHRLPVSVMDVVSFPSTKEHFLITLSRKGKLSAVSIDKTLASQRIVKVRNKKRLAGKFQVGAYDGTNVLVEKADFAVGDSLVLKKAKIAKHLPLSSGAKIVLLGGSHLGMVGTVKEVDGKTIVFSATDKTYSTARRHALVIDQSTAEVLL